MKEGSGTGLIIENSSGEQYEHVLKFMFRASNDEVEYEALFEGRELCCSLGAKAVRAYFDS